MPSARPDAPDGSRAPPTRRFSSLSVLNLLARARDSLVPSEGKRPSGPRGALLMQIKVLILRDPASEPHKPKRRWLRAGAVGAVLASGLAVVTGALAFASIPDANGVFHGCVHTSTGALRIIDTDNGQACKASETAVSWNKAGINWHGAWASTTSYSQGDAVSYHGSSYLAVVTNTDVLPTSPADWAVLAGAGLPGQNGANGQNGTNGATILSGVGPPSEKIGDTGDFYMARGLFGG